MNSQLILAGLLAIVLTLMGGVIPLLRQWRHDHLHGFVCFSAGILMATAFVNLLPHAFEFSDAHTVGYGILASFVALFILEKFVMLHPCEESHCDYHTIGISAFVGMLIHTFFDGFVLATAFMAGGLEWMVFFAIMSHKVPASFSLASILKKANWSHAKIVAFIFVFGAIIPVGAFSSVVVIDYLGHDLIGVSLALSLGAFLYIATSDFLPEVHRVHEGRIRNLFSFLAGIVLIVLMAVFFDVH